MLTKKPKSQFIKNFASGAKYLLIAEGVFLIGSYAIWRRMNTSQVITSLVKKSQETIISGCPIAKLGNKKIKYINEDFMAYLQSALWLVGCTTVAFFLFKTITPTDEEFQKILLKGKPAPKPAEYHNFPKAPPTVNPFYKPPKKDDTEDSDSNKTGK